MIGEVFGFISSIIKPVTNLVDDLVTTDEEKQNIKKAITKMENELKLNLETEITKRWVADAKSDSWLAKNVRPMTLVYLLGLLTAFAFADGNIGSFSIDPAYISLFQSLSITAFGGYFALRGVEKITKIKKGG